MLETGKQVTEPVGKDKLDYHALNALLNLYGEDGKIQSDKDHIAARQFFSRRVNQSTVFFHNLREKLDYLVGNHHYETEVLEEYEFEDVETLFKQAYAHKLRFQTFLDAYKCYTSYTPKTLGDEHYLGHYKDRVCMVVLVLADDDLGLAQHLVGEIIAGRLQPTTSTFPNSGKAQHDRPMSCFLLRIENNMESIGRAINSSLQLSERDGGVALLLSSPREQGAPIEYIRNQPSDVIPVIRLLEDSFFYANQLSAYQGIGAVYLHTYHSDIIRFPGTKYESADKKIRIESLSPGAAILDITFELVKCNDDTYLFSPYDVECIYGKPFMGISTTEDYADMVEGPRIYKRKINAHQFLQTIAETQLESGYPYIMSENTVNRASSIEDRINTSNLCSEILQISTPSTYNTDLFYEYAGEDISRSLDSLNIAMTMDSPDFGCTVEATIRGLTTVSEQISIDSAPSIRKGNDGSHAIGLGQMNLHGYLGHERVMYGLEEGPDFTNTYFVIVFYAVLRAFNKTARERGQKFVNFKNPDYTSGRYSDNFDPAEFQPETQHVKGVFENSTVHVPDVRDWTQLKADIMEYSLFNRNLQVVSPTGSTSCISNPASSIHPVASQTEIRKEGEISRVYYPTPHPDNDNREYLQDAYEIGYEKIIDTYVVATKYISQGLPLTSLFRDTVSICSLNCAQIYTRHKGTKILYHIRPRQVVPEGTEVEGCVSCMLQTNALGGQTSDALVVVHGRRENFPEF